VFSLLHPALLAGVGLVVVPVLIHLLLRQRPRPRPWAAMRWLQAAAQRAQRRWKLTNLLLLLLRCLVLAALALAVARPSIAGLGGGGDLVVVLDVSASMGARGADAGALAAVQAALEPRLAAWRRVTIVTVGGGVRVEAPAIGSQARAALAAVAARPLPGGLDDAATGEQAASVISACAGAPDVLLVSDFQQDDGERLVSLLTPHARRVARWAVGGPAANAAIAGVEPPTELRPGRPADLTVHIQGRPQGVQVAVDQGPFLAADAPVAVAAGATARVVLPPLAAGDHLLRVRLVDGGLAYDNLLEFPVSVREQVPSLLVQEHTDFLGAALGADGPGAVRTVRPAQLATEPLPQGGLIGLRAALADGTRLRDWVQEGGVMWASLARLRADPALAPLVAALVPGEVTAPGGELAAGQAVLDESLRLVRIGPVPVIATLPGVEVLLRAGADPLVVAVPAGSGYIVVELVDLAGDAQFAARGATPQWAVSAARRLCERANAAPIWVAGSPAPRTVRLERTASVAVAVGAPLLVEPGVWRAGKESVVVLPSLQEARLERVPPPGAAADLPAALPRAAGADLGPWLLLLTLLLAFIEWRVAAWAGRRYGA